MARINNEDKYSVDSTISGNELLIGSNDDASKTTRNYKISEIASFIQNNKVIPKFLSSELNPAPSIEDKVNQEVDFTIAADEIYLFIYQYRLQTGNEFVLVTDYYFFQTGKGTYGATSGITTTAGDFILVNRIEPAPIQTISGQSPSVVYLEGNIDTPESVVNNSSDTYVIGATDDYYFVITTPVSTTNNFILSKVYRFIGADGTYGNGGTLSVNGDFLLVQDLSTVQNQTDAIPLSGTIASNPITGTLDFDIEPDGSGDEIWFARDTGTHILTLQSRGETVFLRQTEKSSGFVTSLGIDQSTNPFIDITSDDPNFEGLKSNTDLTPVLQDFSFVQKIFVERLKGQTIKYLVADLPSGPTGKLAHVTDALNPIITQPVVGGGTAFTVVVYNGSDWVCLIQ